MKKLERVRYTLKGDFDPAQTSQMAQAGWRPVAVEWEREVEAPGDVNAAAEAAPHYEELPYGCVLRRIAITWKRIPRRCTRSTR